MPEIRVRPQYPKPYQVRWLVGQKSHAKSFLTKTLADGRRSELMAAARKGEQFDIETGLPKSELAALRPQVTWFEHAKDYAAMKWSEAASAKGRATRADALAAITAALVKDTKGAPAPATLRRALTGYAFNFSEHRTPPPAPLSATLTWLSAKSLAMGAMEDDSEKIRTALKALSTLLSGKRAAATTITNRRTVFNNALRYAVERKRLTVNPLSSVDWSPPATDDEIDFRYVPNPRQAEELITAVGTLGSRGEHLQAFFACIYYAATRPAEAMNLRESDCTLPETGWGVLLLSGSASRVGAAWTDDGKSYEERGLKRRARSSVRDVPIPPKLVEMLRAHIKRYGVAADGRLFRASQGGVVLSKEYSELWQAARKVALSEAQVMHHFAEAPYTGRKAGISFWIASGVDPVEVARRAGHSVAVLYKFYAKVLDGQRDQANARIKLAMRAAEEQAPGA
ncbi:tyrosine-type recombinase/integrase [Streptomyces noursei]|uniref:tyrosine-type recombinase/integrase n=1 Tax=Streptomyces noursei TaxID=1971 RepID=UPI0019AF5ABB|nr:site-specific integrase [Streptomyces noursei]MCZ1017001.1 site-specific integrase [Streptomyces noursei]GGX05388.1 site-specific integrase [Streptomyces noursei]